MKTALRLALSTAVAAALVAALMVWGDVRPAEVEAAVRRLAPGTFAAALGIHAIIYALRAWRFRLLVPPPARPGYGRSLVVSAAHNLAAYVLPAKTGEASFVVYLKSTAGVSAAQGLASLLVSRLLDLAVLCFGLALACLWIAGRGHVETPVPLFAAGGVLAALTLVFAFLGARGELLVAVFSRIASVLRLDRTALGARLVATSARVEAALAGAGGDGRILGAALVSLPLWALVFSFYAVLARGLGLPDSVTFGHAVFGSSLAVLSNLLPINGLAGFGTQEAGWVFGFGWVGVDAELALATGLGAHLVQLLDVVLFGALAHLVMGSLSPPAAAGGDPDVDPAAPQRE